MKTFRIGQKVFVTTKGHGTIMPPMIHPGSIKFAIVKNGEVHFKGVYGDSTSKGKFSTETHGVYDTQEEATTALLSDVEYTTAKKGGDA